MENNTADLAKHAVEQAKQVAEQVKLAASKVDVKAITHDARVLTNQVGENVVSMSRSAFNGARSLVKKHPQIASAIGGGLAVLSVVGIIGLVSSTIERNRSTTAC
jgi:hypothetical protein